MEIKINDTINVNGIDYIVTHYNDYSDKPEMKAFFNKKFIKASMELRRPKGTKIFPGIHTMGDNIEIIRTRR